MNEPPPTDPAAAADAIPEAVALPRRRRNLQLVWLVPLLAALIALVLGARAWIDSGPVITIRFPSAEGLEPGKTRIRYKSVDIGTVKTVRLSADRKAVVVVAEMANGAQSLLRDDTRFWVVRPRFAGGELTGASTLLSGAFIGVDVGKSEATRRDFTGLGEPPSITTDEPGREFVLHSSDLGSIDIGSPVYYRRVNVGKVTAIGLDADGRGVRLRVFLHTPYESLVTRNTRFWHASGVDLSFDGGGIKLQTQSLVSVLLGGIAFGTPAAAAPAAAAAPDHVFTLFNDEARAMKRSDAEVMPLLAHFKESMRGLVPGAPVDFRGVTVGEVKSVEINFDTEAREIRAPVHMVLYRDLIRASAGGSGPDAASAEDLLQRAIARGLRAQLRIGNLITGQRHVALEFARGLPVPRLPASEGAGAPLEIPTLPGGLEDLQATLTQIAKTIERVPFDELATDMRAALKSLRALLDKAGQLPLSDLTAELRGTLASLDLALRRADQVLRQFDETLAPGLGAAISETRQTMKAANELLTSDAPAQQDLRNALQELGRAAQSMRELTDLLQRRPDVLLRGRPTEGSGAAIEGQR